MSDSVTLKFTPKREEFARAYLAMQLRPGTGGAVIAAVALLEVCMLAGIPVFKLYGDPIIRALMFPIPIALLYILVWVPFRLAGRAADNERLTTEKTWQLDDSQVLVQDRFSELRVDWGLFRKVVETRDFYHLQHTVDTSTYAFIPKRAFTTPEQEAAFREIVGRNVKGDQHWRDAKK